ncbi:MAG TPA: spermidine/putrescine ABC transporter substrate-binding protein [Anaerolineales bacterium]|nr:spermidine/putrescine ABC transporter substrate-binding protein [Anaerolineales bacterium]
MKKFSGFHLIVILVIASLVLTACGGQAAPATQAPTEAPAATQPPATEPPAATEAPSATGAPATEAPAATTAPTAFTSIPSDKVTASGYTCPEPQPRMDVTSKELNMFVWTEYIPQDIFDCFQLVYGVTINRDEYSSAEEMFAKFSKGGTNYDVLHVSDNVVPPIIRLGLLEKLDKARLPIMADFDPTYLDLSFDPGNEYTLPYEAGIDAIVVNTDKVPNPPKSWADLWNPDYKGRMVSIDDSRAIIGVALTTLGYDVNTTDQKQLDQAKEKLKQLIPNIKVFDSDSPKTELIAGDVDLGIVWTAEAELAHQENPAITFIYPTEGAINWQDNWAIAANAAHADAAYAWLNYSMQPDLFWMMLRDFPYINPNTAALNFAKGNSTATVDSNGADTTLGALYDNYINSPITNPPADVVKAGHRAVDVGDATALYDQVWTEVKGGQ